jgi:steroid delta-isomerase-like uncharacterized protein
MNESARAVHGLYEALARGDPEVATEHLTEDFVLEDVALGRADGREEATERWRTLLSAFPDVSFRVEREFVSGETVVQEQVVEGHHEGSFLEIPATGATVRFRAAVAAECREGRVAALRLYRDVSTFMAQFAIIVQTAVIAAILNRALPIAVIVGTTFTLNNQLHEDARRDHAKGRLDPDGLELRGAIHRVDHLGLDLPPPRAGKVSRRAVRATAQGPNPAENARSGPAIDVATPSHPSLDLRHLTVGMAMRRMAPIRSRSSPALWAGPS